MNRGRRWKLLAAMAAATIAPGVAAAEGIKPFDRPSLSPVVRWSEDWSALAGYDTTATGDFFDPIKHVPLSEDGEIYASFGGQARLRYEHFSNFGFAPANDDGYLLFRLRAHADVHVGDRLRFFVEGKSAQATDRDLPGGRRTLDVDSLDLQNAFADLRFPFEVDSSLVLRLGRQELSFGKQRLVSPLDWSNTRRTWDGVSAWLTRPGLKATGFYTQFAPVQKHRFNDPDAQQVFYGLYSTWDLPIAGAKLDAYFLGLDVDETRAFNGTAGPEERYTLGGRIFGKRGPFDYDFEAAYQFGEVGAGDVSAWMIGSQLGYKLTDVPTAPRLFVGFDYGSGDESPGGDVQTFNQLYPLGHAYLGWIDAVGRQNILDLSVGAELTPAPRWGVVVAGHFFWRDEEADALYNAGGGVLRAGAPGTSKEVGSEIDLLIKHQLDAHTQLLFGYSHFFAGQFIEETGPSEDIDFVYTSVEFTF